MSVQSRKRKSANEAEGCSARVKQTINEDRVRVLTKKHYDLKDGLPILTVALTGASQGDLLHGVVREGSSASNDSAGVILQVVSGRIEASHVVSYPLDEDDLVRAYMRDYRLSREVAVQKVRSRHMSAPEQENAHPMGSSCPTTKGIHYVYGDKSEQTCTCPNLATFRIIEPGIWVDIADTFGNKDQLMEYVLGDTEVNWRQILSLFGNKTLMLRSRLFAVVAGPRVVVRPSESALRCALRKVGDAVTYDVSGDPAHPLEVTVDKGEVSPEPNTKARAIELVSLACPGADESILPLIYDTLRPLTNGALKSAMQKAVRFGARFVQLGPDGPKVPASDYAAMTCCMLALNPGGFVPQIQQMVRGVVSAFKRTVVILIEDAYAGSPRQLQGLFGTALVCQRNPSFHPCTSSILLCIRLLWQAAQSDTLLDWRPHVDGHARQSYGGRQLPATVKAEVIPSNAKYVKYFRNLTFLLQQLRSFAGDIAMIATVAKLAKRQTGLPVLRCLTRPALMPDCHLMDQHTQPGMGHVVLNPALNTFAERFTMLFGKVTGMNPRKDAVDGFEERKEVQTARFAQRVFMRFVTSAARTALPVASERNEQHAIDPGTLAAGVGPVETSVKLPRRKRINLLVVLPTHWPKDTPSQPEEVVMLQPSRAKVDDYLEWGNKEDADELAQSDRERQAARQLVRDRTLAVRSPLLPRGNATFVHGCWHFQGRPWIEWMADGVLVKVSIHPPPAHWPAVPPTVLLHDNQVLSEALSVTGTGMCEDARARILTLCDGLPQALVARTHGLLRQRYEHFSMPVPARDGGLGADQLQAYAGDWDAWRLLVLFSRLVPGALRPALPPRFDVPNAVLLSMVTSWMSSRREVMPMAEHTQSPWAARPAWAEGYATAIQTLRVHQRDAVERMKQRHLRGAPGHYLVMDTGHGKTYTAVTYAMWRLLHTALGHQVRRIIWVTPPGSKLDKSGKAGDPRNFQLIRSLMDEFQTNEALIPLPVSFVDKTAATVEAMFPEFTICVVHHDHLRSMPDKLVSVANSSFMIFDEGDNFYGISQRTSMALRVARLSPDFIIQTATPVPGSGNLDRLAEWLGLTEEYPVTRRNYLVAACNMVSLKISLGITSHYLVHEVERTPAAEQAFRRYTADKDWNKLFHRLQRETNQAFCERAHYHAVRDRKETPRGGCFVVCEGDRHVQQMLELFRELYRDVRCGDASDMANPAVAVVFVTSTNCRGYNSGVRMGVQIRQPYPGSAASRQQMEGRIRRMNQRREQVTYEVVYMQHTLMHLLHTRQQRDDNVNHSLEQLAEEYDRTAIEF
eukprot:m.1002282 g.1002282  ORF g.1002282 m.1002282 type:complete len:1307 (+) comp24035_c0_seq5:70-3990(+)